MAVDSTTVSTDSTALPYPFGTQHTGDLYFKDPSVIKSYIDYDPERNEYVVLRQAGGYNIVPPALMTQREYSDYVFNKEMKNYFKKKKDAIDGKKRSTKYDDSSLLPKFQVNSKFFETLFGGNTIEINPQGYASLDLGGNYQKVDNPAIPENNRGNFNFDFDQRISLSVVGKIGTKLRIQTNYDTQATFNFQNQVKLDFTGNEDDIVEKVELGNVSLPINNSLIKGAQSLFGVKAKLKFGNTSITGVFSEQKSESKTISTQGGSTLSEFEFYIDKYDENRHFLMSQYFFDTYDAALESYPYINSRINITRLEVWVTNRTSVTEGVRNIVALTDLGESNPFNPDVVVNGGMGSTPNNQLNSLDPATLPQEVRDISSVQQGLPSSFMESRDWVVLENARLLNPADYTFNTRLGFISLNQPLNNDEVLAVAFQYTIDGETFQVGEFSNDGIDSPDALIVKMLKSNITDVKNPIWDLMMKNVYSLGSYQVSAEEFRLDLLYFDDAKGVPTNYLSDANNPLKDKILLHEFNWDRLNKNRDFVEDGDGYFDYVEGITINSRTGRIFFTKIHPFGSYLEQRLEGETDLIDKYVYNELYETTKFQAQQETRKNKFLIRGRYKSGSSAGIPLGAINVPRGSVTVTSGGRELMEGVDYTVDYQLGMVKVINENLIATNAPIQVSLENNSTFSLQTRRFVGMNLEHRFNDNLLIGATVINLSERPITQKSNFGAEPISNTILGANISYEDDAPYLTKFADAITPFQRLEAPSQVSVQGEFAYLKPGSARGNEIAGEPASYIDDFEGSQIDIDLRSPSTWYLAATPGGDGTVIDDGNQSGLPVNYSRAKLAWYMIDPMFYNDNTRTPNHIKNDKDATSDLRVRRVDFREIFPKKEIPIGTPTSLSIFDLAYYPGERGPYNFNKANINDDGSLVGDPRDNWAGITKPINTNNFEESNVEFIQFWLQDPYHEDYEADGYQEGGDLYINLGTVSEDLLKDGRKSFENGAPTDGFLDNPEEVNETPWGFVPKKQSLIYSFSASEAEKVAQDNGADGMDNPLERDKFNDFLQGVPAGEAIFEDPSGDDYFYYRSSAYDAVQASILDRYKHFNNPEGNNTGKTMPAEPYPLQASNVPDIEDVNQDQTLNTAESYFQYRVSMRRADLQTVGENNITDIRDLDVELPNGERKSVRWIQFKIPVFSPEKKVGGINDFRSIRFMRMFLTQFSDPVVLRFAELKFVRGEWRRYGNDLREDRLDLPLDPDSPTLFEANVVNLEENDTRDPIPYVMPPGIERVVLYNSTSTQAQNEQSLSLRLCDFEDEDIRAAFKNVSFDMRRYKRLKMFIHGEAAEQNTNLNDGDLTVFVRIGADYDRNYYQYEVPINPTRWGANTADEIWPEENNLDLAFEALQNLKIDRDNAIKTGVHPSAEIPFMKPDGKNMLVVKGNPNYGNVRNLMIGVRNTSGDPVPKCAEVWVNELRLTDFDDRSGWAASGRFNANFSDLGDVSLTGYSSTIGFGSLEQSVSERSIEDVMQYDFAANVNAGKFFPKNWLLNIPFFYSKNEEFRDPQFDPIRPDIELNRSLNSLQTSEESDSLLNVARDYTSRTTYSLNNVKKQRKEGKKAQLYHIENISLSYSNTQVRHQDVNTEYYEDKHQTAAIDYNYSRAPKAVEPFRKAKWVQSPYLALIRDFNFYYMPSKLTFRADGERRYIEEKYRNLDQQVEIKIDPIYNKNFKLNYQWAFNFDLSKRLKFDFNARSSNIVDEPAGAIDDEARDIIWENVKDFGRPTQYHHRININYKFPLDKIPFTDWMELSYKYSADYDWRAYSTAMRFVEVEQGRQADLGNVVQNANTQTWNGRMNFNKLYSKFGKSKKSNGRNNTTLDRLRSGKSAKKAPSRKSDKSAGDKFKDFGIDFITMVKDISGNYSLNSGQVLPGFTPEPGFLGYGRSGGGIAPTFGFLVGDQSDIRHEAFLQGYLSADARFLNEPYSRNEVEKLNLKANVEPFKNFKIDLNMNKSYTASMQEFYEVDYSLGNPEAGVRSLNPQTRGNYSSSIITIATAFKSSTLEDAPVFDQFKENRLTVAERLADRKYGTGNWNRNQDGYPEGFGPQHQEVMIGAFISAYTGRDATSSDINPFQSIPLPNWNVTYTGLMDYKFFKNNFKNFTLSHAYKSGYAINGFSTNLNFMEGQDSFDMNGNLIPQLQYSNLNISEQFNPLIKVDVTMVNNVSLKAEYKKDRLLSMDLINSNMNEINGQEYVIGAGYRIKDLSFMIRSKNRRKRVTSDLNLKLDISYRNNNNLVRNINEESDQVTGGENFFTLKTSADYNFSKRLTLMVYFEQTTRSYEISTAYPTYDTRAGFNVRFNLGN